MTTWEDFSEIWVADFEYFPENLNSNNNNIPVCVCAKELKSGRIIQEWLLDVQNPKPLPLTDSSLFVSFNADAEMSCYIKLNWERPLNIYDLRIEFMQRMNNSDKKNRGWSKMLSACAYYNINGDSVFKDETIKLILTGGPFSETDKSTILKYCMLDVELETQLLYKFLNEKNLTPALIRGRYMWAIAMMTYNGIPLDVEKLEILKREWDRIQLKLIDKINKLYGIYEDGVFKERNLENYVKEHNIPWDRTKKGHLMTDKEYFKEQAKCYPILKPLQELRSSIGQMRLSNFNVGEDGRTRTWLNPFSSKTSRNQPSSSEFIFGPATWVRSLIKPKEGYSIAYVDFEQEEIGVAAALSQDINLIAAYNSGDPYLNFAKQYNFAPESATKKTHSEIRDILKTCFLAMNYGLGIENLAKKTNISYIEAKELHRSLQNSYRTYWKWITKFMDEGKLTGKVSTRLGWEYYTKNSKSSTLQNFPMQANSADILRIATILCLENGIKVCAPVHDALVIESKTKDIEEHTRITIELMKEASLKVIKFPLRAEATIVNYPDRYMDKRGRIMWETIWEAVEEVRNGE